MSEIIQELITKGGWTQFFAAFCCGSAAGMILFSWRKRKLKIRNIPLKEFYNFFLWFFGFLWWFFNIIGLMIIEESFTLGLFFLKLAGFFIIFHLYNFLPFLLVHITQKRKINVYFSILFGGVWFSFMFYYLINAQLIYRPVLGDIYFTAPGLPTPGALMGGLDLFFLALSIWLIFFNFKRKFFSFEDLSSFYIFFSVVIYGAVSLLNVLFIQTRHLTYFVFILIPILTYLGYKKYYSLT
jgi:hypothetical protein